MGLAPWHISSSLHTDSIFSGHIANGTLSVNWDVLSAMEREIIEIEAELKQSVHNQGDQVGLLQTRFSGLAYQVQREIEDKTLEFIAHMKQLTNASQLCFAGGVAQNPVLNGRIVRELGFDRVHVPFCSGDEGIAIGCAMFGVHWLNQKRGLTHSVTHSGQHKKMSPFLGKEYSEEEIESSVEEHSNWLIDVSHDDVNDDDDGGVDMAALEIIAREELELCCEQAEIQDEGVSEEVVSMIAKSAVLLSRGEVVGWFQGRAEFGPRALGARSLLADPRNGQ